MAGKQSDAGGDPRELEARADNIKVILLGDSAVGKSKLVERFMMDAYHPQQLSTYALTLFEHNAEIDGRKVKVDFWDTAGQERFNSMHPSYYYKAHVCLLVFDVTRKVTYKNLSNWYKELQEYRKGIPVIVVANKIDVDYRVTQKTFNFAVKHDVPRGNSYGAAVQRKPARRSNRLHRQCDEFAGRGTSNQEVSCARVFCYCFCYILWI
eukprot:TRINITY_DN2687_c0_g1_i2.p1 TRINITY_DN2687_c0_g1~~TRINITY_DN2687_c0_g1_i2.p1  ORF type:complete len:209 (-),score=20.17 TRINITY_DN2687_c0_g1_i2:139-765(-)